MNAPCPPDDAHGLQSLTSALRAAISALTRTPEPDLLPGLLDQARLTADQAEAVQALAGRIASGVCERSRAAGRAGLVQGLLQERAGTPAAATGVLAR